MFPEVERTFYRRNPLDRVICQLRFPPILKIDTEIPAAFQDRLRDRLPDFSAKQELPLPLPPDIPEEVQAEFIRHLTPISQRNYAFTSEDDGWRVNLTRTFMALTAKKYTRRRDFRQYLTAALSALHDIYSPPYFTRIGLRYVDVIQRSELQLDCSWRELLKPHALWILGSPGLDLSTRALTFSPKCEIALDDGGATIRVAMSFVERDLIGQAGSEQCLVIDTDLYTTARSSFQEVTGVLDSFHIEGLRSFRWLISDRLHQAMDPEVITDE